jgi:hypothetical protein
MSGYADFRTDVPTPWLRNPLRTSQQTGSSVCLNTSCPRYFPVADLTRTLLREARSGAAIRAVVRRRFQEPREPTGFVLHRDLHVLFQPAHGPRIDQVNRQHQVRFPGRDELQHDHPSQKLRSECAARELGKTGFDRSRPGRQPAAKKCRSQSDGGSEG